MPTTSQQKDPLWIAKGADQISHAIQTSLADKRGILVGRQGSLEFEILYGHWILKMQIPPELQDKLQTNAGVFPKTAISLHGWIQEYTKAVSESDILVSGWLPENSQYEIQFLTQVAPNAQQIVLRALEPYYVEPEKRWTRLLAGRKVCVVSSFADTMRSQIRKRQEIWPTDTESLLPETTEWSFVKTFYPNVLDQESSCVWPSSISDWTKALKKVHEEVLQTGAEIVLIGWGALAMPVARHLKKKGKCVIVLGGAIQNLFGIKGSRWQSHPVISQFWNEAWVSPSPQEVPPHAPYVESGCYW